MKTEENRWVDLSNGVAWAIIFSLVAIIMSIIAISTRYPRTDLSFDYMGLIVGILSLLVTALIGWQVYNAIEMRGVIRDYDKLKHRLENYNQVQIDRILRVDNLNEARRLFNNSKTNKHGLLSNRYKDAIISAKLFLDAGCNSKDNEFLRSISQMEFLLEMADVVSDNIKGDFKSIKDELDGAYKAIIQKLSLEKTVVEQLITDINACHSKRQKLSNS